MCAECAEAGAIGQSCIPVGSGSGSGGSLCVASTLGGIGRMGGKQTQVEMALAWLDKIACSRNSHISGDDIDNGRRPEQELGQGSN